MENTQKLCDFSNPEYREIRCCMCPNIDQNKFVCPGITDTPHPQDSPCRFVKMYRDNKNRLYFVRPGIGQDSFKTFCRKPGKHEHGYRQLPWQSSFDQAQSDLNIYARQKGWIEA
jgi:hypothetical protein